MSTGQRAGGTAWLPLAAPVRLPGRALPVPHDVDVAVVGGTLAGTAAAVELARAGRRVLLLEQGYALGTDLTAANRPWLTVPADGPAAAPSLLRPLLPSGAAGGARLALRPAALKLHLESALLDAGGLLVYGVRPLAVHHRDGAVRGPLAGLVIANKSGRQLVRCTQALDATGADPVLRAAAGLPPVAEPERAVWSVEFDGVEPDEPFADDVVSTAGCRGPGHLYALLATSGGRRAAVRAAGRLLRQHPAFAKATLGAVATDPLSGPPPPTADTRTPLPGLHATPAPPHTATPADPLLDPPAALHEGTRLGRALATACDGEPNRGRAAQAPPRPGGSPPSGPEPNAGVVGAGWVAPGGPADSAGGVPGVPPGGVVPRSPSYAVGEQDAPQRGRGHPREVVRALDVDSWGEADVLVVGGGTSGASAALAAAREGARTVLVEAGPGPGGTGTYGGVHSYWFGRREGHAAQLQQATRLTHRELGLRGGVGQWNIEAKALALHDALREAGVRTVYHARAFAALHDGGGEEAADARRRVTGALFSGPGGPFAVTARVVVDATGDADLAAWCGAPCEVGAAGVHTVMWASLARFDTPGTTRNQFGGLADMTDVADTTRAVLAARRRSADMHDHGTQPAARETRHLVGETVVTLTDQLTGRHWPDVVNVHFSNHDLKGKGEALWPQLGLVPPNLEIELPYRALLPRGLDGLLVTGKALSATHDALPALRMQADLENLGEVTGLAAAACAATGRTPREVDVAALQRELVRRGRLPAETVRATHPAPAARPTLAALIAELAEHLPLHSYSDMGRREVFRGHIPFVRLALDADPAVTPALLGALRAETAPAVRIVLAQLLALRGRPEGADVLLGHLAERLAGDRLPPRTSRIREAQLPPDQSAMPDEAYLLHTLGYAREPRAVPLWERVALLVDAREDAFRDPAAAPFAWVDAVCAGAERLGSADAVPALERLHDRPALHGQHRTGGIEPDDVQERRALLELALGRALAACGSPRGPHILVRYLDDNRALLAEQAHSRLAAFTGADHGKDGAAWLRHLAVHGVPGPAPLPYAHDPHAADLPGVRAPAPPRAAQVAVQPTAQPPSQKRRVSRGAAVPQEDRP
ncbi:FAD-dependent oxidoreductase [Streptomyces armeniacus]|uniref:FAD-dependent oxidoreductase n=1 Tax=Streptomyces armeniacus TaxID=83291 RepID=A0A345XJ30_9ACTN|nr:FAD-dependent oxidoreductase [Streptomyces armeniacus]AXK31646.1 FAD-dependent oxidoreductase [Streptomyces armeniacus]